MDPFEIAADIGGLVGTSYAVGNALYGLCNGRSSASREFEVFSQEVNHFASVWSIVQPRLENPPTVLTNVCLATLDRILEDTGQIVRQLRLSVELFSSEYEKLKKNSHHAFIRVAQTAAGRSEKAVREKKLKEFLNRGAVTLQRSQMHYATTVLNIVLATIDHAHSPTSPQRSSLHANNEVFLFYEEHRARTRLQEDEIDTGSPPTASSWVEDMPTSPRRRFDALVQRWTKPIPQELRQSFAHVPGLREYVQSVKQESDDAVVRLQRRIDEQREGDRAVIADLQQTVQILRQDGQRQSEEMETRIDGLLGEIRDYQQRLHSLENQCHRYRIERDAARASAAAAERSFAPLQQSLANLQQAYDTERQTSERRRNERNVAERNLRDLRTQTQASRQNASQPRRDLDEMQRSYQEAVAARDEIQADYVNLKDDLKNPPSSWKTNFSNKSTRRPSHSSGSSRTFVEHGSSSANTGSPGSRTSGSRYSESDDDHDYYESAYDTDYRGRQNSKDYQHASDGQRYEYHTSRSPREPSTHRASDRGYNGRDKDSKSKSSNRYRRR